LPLRERKSGEGKLGYLVVASFLSKFTNKVDGKGRVSVPADFREEVAQTPFNGIILRLPIDDKPYIEGEDIARTQALSESLYDSYDVYDEEQAAIADLMLSSIVKLSFDPEGRVTLPKELREHAGIDLKGQATFVGRGPFFQIWNADAYTAHNAALRDKVSKGRAMLGKIPSLKAKRGDV